MVSQEWYRGNRIGKKNVRVIEDAIEYQRSSLKDPKKDRPHGKHSASGGDLSAGEEVKEGEQYAS